MYIPYIAGDAHDDYLDRHENNKHDAVTLNWSEYMFAERIEVFEKKSRQNKKIYFESDNARDQILLQTKGVEFDLILANCSVINTYRN